MLPLFNFNESEILAFALVFIRVSAFIVVWPVFSVYNVPQPLKVLFALTISVVVFPVLNSRGFIGSGLDTQIIPLVLQELLVGVCLGFVARFVFFAVSVGGNLVSTSVGLANGSLFNPSLGASSTTVEQFYGVLATLLFLSLNGHHLFITGLMQSFESIPINVLTAKVGHAGFGGVGANIALHNIHNGFVAGAMSGQGVATPNEVGINILFKMFSDGGLIVKSIVEAGIKIAAPVMVAVFFMNMAMGIMGRAVPQINVLVTSMSVNFVTGLAVMIVAIPALILELDNEILTFAGQMFAWLKH